MKKIRISLLLLVFISVSSCVSKKNIVYFNTDSIDQSKVTNTYRTIYKPDDLLQITVSTEDIVSSQAFNLPVVTFSSTTNSVVGSPKQQDYLVDKNGYITFPVIGKLKIGGLSREEAINLLRDKLIPEHLKKAIINIRISNFKITVSGDVKNPGTFRIPYERITIMEALGLAGDLNISGQRNNILVIREEGNRKTTYRVDLTSMKTLNSPVYYLQQNDFIYVEPNGYKAQHASSNPNTGIYISITSILITLLTI